MLGYGALILACAASALAGGYSPFRAFATTVEPFTLGTARVSAVPALDGHVDVTYRSSTGACVPNRTKRPSKSGCLSLTRSSRGTRRAAVQGRRRVRGSRASARGRRRRTARIRRSILLGHAGGLIGGLLAGGVIGAVLHRRRWLAYGAAAGLVAPLAFVGLVLATLRTSTTRRRTADLYAHGQELPRLLTFSGQLLTAGDDYMRSYEQALAGRPTLSPSPASRAGDDADTTTAVLASDLHANTWCCPCSRTTRATRRSSPRGTSPTRTKSRSRPAPALQRLGDQVVGRRQGLTITGFGPATESPQMGRGRPRLSRHAAPSSRPRYDRRRRPGSTSEGSTVAGDHEPPGRRWPGNGSSCSNRQGTKSPRRTGLPPNGSSVLPRRPHAGIRPPARTGARPAGHAAANVAPSAMHPQWS